VDPPLQYSLIAGHEEVVVVVAAAAVVVVVVVGSREMK
jgi:hypothetical protein